MKQTQNHSSGSVNSNSSSNAYAHRGSNNMLPPNRSLVPAGSLNCSNALQARNKNGALLPLVPTLFRSMRARAEQTQLFSWSDQYYKHFATVRAMLAVFGSHARGKKKRHSWRTCLEEPLELPRCSECHRRVGDRRCEGCEADLCDSCQAFTHARVRDNARTWFLRGSSCAIQENRRVCGRILTGGGLRTSATLPPLRNLPNRTSDTTKPLTRRTPVAF